MNKKIENKKTDLNHLVYDLKKTENLNLNKLVFLLNKHNFMHGEDIKTYIDDNMTEIIESVDISDYIELSDLAPITDY